MFPSKDDLTICFAHAAYRMQDRFELRRTGIRNFQVWGYDDFVKRIPEADVVVVSGMWRNDLIAHAGNLKFIQSISSGMDQYSKEQLAAKGVRLASAAGVNARAVAEHALALILAVMRRLPEARDNQHRKMWRGMLGDLTEREDELGGKTVLIVGMGRIGSHLAKLCKAFDMTVLGIRRDPAQGANGADSIHGMAELVKLAPQADFVALTCALTAETTGLMNAAAFAAMKPYLALYMGGMGAEDTNFHADVYRRMGYSEVVDEVTTLFRGDRKDEAATIIPDELVDDAAIVGDLDYVRKQVEVWEAAGVTMMVVTGRSTDELGRLAELAKSA